MNWSFPGSRAIFQENFDPGTRVFGQWWPWFRNHEIRPHYSADLYTSAYPTSSLWCAQLCPSYDLIPVISSAIGSVDKCLYAEFVVSSPYFIILYYCEGQRSTPPEQGRKLCQYDA